MSAVPTYREALDAAAQAMAVVAREHGIELAFPTLLAEAAVSAYLPAHWAAITKRVGSHYSENTRKIAALNHGEAATVAAMTLSSLHGRIKAARNLMGNDLASWAWTPLPSGEWRVERLADGQTRPRILKSPITRELVSMHLRESIISKTLTAIRGKGALMPSHRIVARAYLDNPDAAWTTRATNRGIRLTRVK